MKRLLLFLISLVFVLASATLYAAERAPLGGGDLAVKVDYIHFSDGEMKDFDTNSGAYFGIEAYSEIADVLKHLYVGAEVGITTIDGHINGIADTHTRFIPVEFNLKYALTVTPEIAIDFGAGGSINYGKLEQSSSLLGSFSVDDWMIGGQGFVDLNYKLHQFFVGVNAKYQIMENFKDSDVNFRNWRFGGQIGIMF